MVYSSTYCYRLIATEVAFSLCDGVFRVVAEVELFGVDAASGRRLQVLTGNTSLSGNASDTASGISSAAVFSVAGNCTLWWTLHFKQIGRYGICYSPWRLDHR